MNSKFFESVKIKPFINEVKREIGRRFRPAIIVCPGGAYSFRSDTEGDYVAIRFQASGYQAFVLNYSVGQCDFPTALFELADAVKFVRENADVLDVDPSRIYVCGFSAGGHLAASLGVFWNNELLVNNYPEAKIIKPNGLILSYPVITTGEYSHRDTINNISNKISDERRGMLSLEKQVTSCMPRTFIWTTLDDNEVMSENSLLLAGAMRRAGVSFELHVFPHGVHGMSLATEYTAVSEDHIDSHIAHWFDLAIEWEKEIYNDQPRD